MKVQGVRALKSRKGFTLLLHIVGSSPRMALPDWFYILEDGRKLEKYTVTLTFNALEENLQSFANG